MKTILFLKHAAVFVALVAAFGGSQFASVGYAADPKLDQAIDSVMLAINLVEAAEFPNDVTGRCERPRDKVIRELDKAIDAIERTKTCADEPPGPRR